MHRPSVARWNRSIEPLEEGVCLHIVRYWIQDMKNNVQSNKRSERTTSECARARTRAAVGKRHEEECAGGARLESTIAQCPAEPKTGGVRHPKCVFSAALITQATFALVSPSFAFQSVLNRPQYLCVFFHFAKWSPRTTHATRSQAPNPLQMAAFISNNGGLFW